MAKLLGPDQGPDLRRGVRKVVSAHRPARIRRHDASLEGSQRKLRPPDREELHPVPQTDHLAALRAADPPPLRRAPHDGPGGPRGRGFRHDGHLALQHADQHRKYKESVRNSGPQENNHRPAAESEPHVRDLHRGRVQPAGPLGGHVRGGEPGKQPLQSSLYIWGFGAGKDPHRAVDRPRGAPAPPGVAGAVRLDEQVPGAVPDGLQERRDSRLHPLLPDDRRADHRRHPGVDGKRPVRRTRSSTSSTTCNWRASS